MKLQYRLTATRVKPNQTTQSTVTVTEPDMVMAAIARFVSDDNRDTSLTIDKMWVSDNVDDGSFARLFGEKP